MARLANGLLMASLAIALLLAGGAAALQSSELGVVLHVHRDGSLSMSVDASGTVPRGQAALDLVALATIGSDVIQFQALANGSLPEALEGSSIDAHFKMEGEAGGASASGYLRLRDPSGNSLEVRLEYLNFSLNASSAVGTVVGAVNVSAEGSAAAVVPWLAFLNKRLVDEMLAKANATWISAKDVEVTVRGSSAEVRFSLECNLSAANATRPAGAAPGLELRRLELNMSAAGASFALNLSGTLRGNVNALLNAISSTNLGDMAKGVLGREGIGPQKFDKALELIREFSENFEVLPSSASLNLSTTKDGFARLHLETPKFVKRNATRPEDSLAALQGLLEELLEDVGLANAARVGDYRIGIAAEPGVKVTLNGSEVSEVPLGNLSSLRVEIVGGQGQLPLAAAAGLAVAGAAAAAAYVLARRGRAR
ncbi:MAG: hypothetical protein ABWK00_04190 [Desulfurococcaceae archaeon]